MSKKGKKAELIERLQSEGSEQESEGSDEDDIELRLGLKQII